MKIKRSSSTSQPIRTTSRGTHNSCIKLYKFHEVPSFQQFNPYILSGYRAFLSAKECLWSILVWSNESLNIWSHLCILIYSIYLLITDEFVNLPSHNAAGADYFVFFIWHIGNQLCMALSTLYHTFNSHQSEKYCMGWFSADLAGITAAILGSWVLGLYYGFYCFDTLRNGYMVFCALMITVSMTLMFNPKYITDQWGSIRVCHLSSLCVFGLIPILHWLYVSPAARVDLFMPHIIKFYLIQATALLTYLSKFPECVMPGTFDFIGQSHTFWHLLVSYSLLHWRKFALIIVEHHSNNKCF